MIEVRLILYVTGQSSRQQQAVEGLRRVCQQQWGDRCLLEIVDVTQHPEQAAAEHVLAAPALVRSAPPPRRCVVGDLAHPARVLRLLGLTSSGWKKRQEIDHRTPDETQNT